MPHWIRRGLLAAVSAALALGGLELWARATWIAPWYERLVTEQTGNQRLLYTKNAQGLRDRDYPSPKPADRLRLLILGDSFTYGLGVPEDELVFPELLERELDRMSWPGKSGVDVLNGGIPGSLAQDWVQLWERVKDDFQPDALLLAFFLRDGTQLGSMGYFEEFDEQINEANAGSALYQRSYLYRVLRDLQVRRRFQSRYRSGFQQAYFGSDEETRTWQRAQVKLLKLRDWARARGLAVGLAVYPILVELGEDYPFQPIQDLVVDFGRANELPTLDLLTAFRGHYAPDLWVSAGDQHPNARGHAITAEALLPFAVELLRSTLPHSTR